MTIVQIKIKQGRENFVDTTMRVRNNSKVVAYFKKMVALIEKEKIPNEQETEGDKNC